jgi:hypothetical protein
VNVFELPFALIAFLGFVALVPAWMWFLATFPPAQNLSAESRLLANFVLPATVMLTLASWLEGGSAR